MTLGEAFLRKENNLNLLRLIAALGVLISHSFPLSTGSGASEPFRESLGMTIGTLSVFVFFFISGMLVTSSAFTRGSIVDFARSRVLRIYPALLVMLSLTVFVLGPLVSEDGAREYFSHQETYRYFAYCATLFKGVVYALPGVFVNNPYAGSVNGSLWTMPWEVRLYAVLGAAFVLSSAAGKYQLRTAKAIVIALAAFSADKLLKHYFVLHDDEGVYEVRALWLMFTIGSISYLFRHSIRISRAFFYLSILSLAGASLIGGAWLLFATVLFLPYLIIHFAYTENRLLGAASSMYSNRGDYSYGIYIYAFPIQQIIAHEWHSITPVEMIAISLPITLVFAIASWHLVEKRSLALKKKVDAVIG